MTGREAQGAGSIIGALATVYGIKEQSEYQDQMLDFEEARVATETKKDKDRQTAYEAVWATDHTAT